MNDLAPSVSLFDSAVSVRRVAILPRCDPGFYEPWAKFRNSIGVVWAASGVGFPKVTPGVDLVVFGFGDNLETQSLVDREIRFVFCVETDAF